MGRFDIFDQIDRLRQSGARFTVATVLRTADATSAKAGAKAVVTEDGNLHGHLGGACVQTAVRQAAAQALAQGAPRMIRVKPNDKIVAVTDPDGAQVFGSGCPSGGTVDLLIEPYAPPPWLVIFGETPISRAIAAHGALAGLRIAQPVGGADGAQPVGGADGARPVGRDPVARFARLDDLALGPGDFVTVAAQGQGDLAALRQAVLSPARHISMVASRRKAEVLKGKLIAEGIDEALVHRLKSPAGLDIGAIDPHEIALSVLAEIVRWRHAQDTAPQAASA